MQVKNSYTQQQQQQIQYYSQQPALVYPQEQINPQLQQQYQNTGGMVAPALPMANYYPVPFDQQLFNMKGKQRLQNLQTAHVKAIERGSCGDIALCIPAPTSIAVQTDRGSMINQFVIKFKKVGCLDKDLEGEFFAPSQDQNVKDKLYDVEHKRNCYWCKCPFVVCHPLGMLNWMLCNLINPSTSTLKKGGNTKYKFQYGTCCANNAQIQDEDGKLKYMIKNPGNCLNFQRILYDKNGVQVQGFQMNTTYGGHKQNQRISADIIFPPTMTEDDKAAIIYAMMRMN